MTIIKFDSEKADALIRDLTKISSDIESNLGKVYTNSYGKEISLSDTRLKVYAYRDKLIDIVQEDGSVIQETIKEKYLKNNFVANARAYNQHIRNLYKRSSNAKTKATQSIESVINSLNKIKALISEFETEHSLRLSSSLDDVGQFDFNFLSAYGPMGKPDNYSPSFGTVVVDEAFTSHYLGMLGERPTSINLEKLAVFDSMFDIARDNALSYEDKMNGFRNLLMENVLKINPEEAAEKSRFALESMIGILDSHDIKIDDNLKIETLIKMDIPVIEDLKNLDLAVDLEVPDGVIGGALIAGATLVQGIAPDLNLDIDGDGKPASGVIDSIEAGANAIVNGVAGIGNQMGIDTDVVLDVKPGGPNNGHIAPAGPDKGKENFWDSFQDSMDKVKPDNNGQDKTNNIGKGVANAIVEGAKDVIDKAKPQPPAGNGEHHNDPKPGNENIDGHKKVEIHHEAPKVNSAPPKNDVIKAEKVELPKVNEEPKLSAEDIAIDKELHETKIDLSYKAPTVDNASDASDSIVQIDDTTGKKGAGIIAGAAGLGALSNSATGGNASVPQVNGMAAGEIFGGGNSAPTTSAPVVLDGNLNSTPATGGVPTSTPTTPTSVGGESTADRGSVVTGGSVSKSSGGSVSGRGGATLEDKDTSKNENSYGKPNKPSDIEDNTQKGMLGDASIAELDAKDEKQIKVATGVTAGTVLASGVLAIANVFPWLMLIIALIAIGGYIAYRSKKKKDKEKRKAMLAAKQQQDAANATVTLEAVQNVVEMPVVTEPVATENTVVETPTVANEVVEPVVSNDVNVNVAETPANITELPQGAPIVGGEFSEQPYEPSRDGVTEIGGNTSNL